MKKVLIAVDYHPNAEKVIRSGHQLAKMIEADICLIHVLSDVRFYDVQFESFMGYEGYSFPMNYQAQEDVVKMAQEYLEKTAKILNDENVSIHITEGDTSEALLKYAEEWNADVIVMGTHSYSTLEKIFLGTVASSVLEKTKIPVYMVPIE